ncbi:anhydro-N-acetylmuramic acid kinase [Paenibacillus sp. LHD-117]|uniref:anhydro-N-acetylmuramic acid kinase n=1 Tax=Paenibacillus sp. LHD-117 TaxID=3071412 RepID=UPI0027E0A3A0|nr:anhydro-N-acetylmuramic acid kinase [Paenibacillus sp. LHD-117]MDQ6418766.1 anhydro-N-acetylmuramic acid kinase [Paenibacillus sp. LHD-117]
MFQWVQEKPYVYAVGLMSGTSLDGVDAAVVRIDGSGLDAKVRLVHYYTRPYDEALRKRLKELCDPATSDVSKIGGMNVYIAERFAEAAIEAVHEAGLAMSDIAFVSSHGQTVWHMPEASPSDPFLARSTLQIGDLSVIAKRTGRLTVGDFRPADMAVGGQGAPLVPYGDLILFRHPSKGRLLQNIGGIGNCTALPAGASADDLFAFDTGPGNMVIDQVVHTLTDGRMGYDAEGAWAAQGKPDETLLAEMLAHPYFRMAPPKSTGRELFGAAYTAEYIAKATKRGLEAADIVATATAFTARSIADACRDFVSPRCRIDEVIVSGGGAHNRTMLTMLADLLPEQKILTSGELGLADDAKEAVIFALLGNDFLRGIPNNIPAATGALRPTVMGKLAMP